MKIDFNPHRDGFGDSRRFGSKLGHKHGYGSGSGFYGDGYGFGYINRNGYEEGAGNGGGHYNRKHENHCYSLIWRKIK